MRITSIGANYNTLRPQNQNIGFGQFQDKKVKKAYEGIAIDPEFNDVEEIYKRDVAGCKYIEKSPYVTVKGAKDKKGKYFYAEGGGRGRGAAYESDSPVRNTWFCGNDSTGR